MLSIYKRRVKIFLFNNKKNLLKNRKCYSLFIFCSISIYDVYLNYKYILCNYYVLINILYYLFISYPLPAAQ